uniref:Insulin-like domain-containing protein n=1 Tax=Sinocyclocheilus anshuiensis TaxID=1608454 RepID=A0A671Q5L1_9TELE
ISKTSLKTLRLCGREFFQAVVYTCGGSRWSLHPNVSESRKQTLIAYEALPSTCCKVGCRKSDLVRMC